MCNDIFEHTDEPKTLPHDLATNGQTSCSAFPNSADPPDRPEELSMM